MKLRFAIAAALYCALLLAFWDAARFFRLQIPLGPTLASFALLFAPFWFFGLGGAELVRAHMPRTARIAAALYFVFPYLVFALPLDIFNWRIAAGLIVIPFVVAALLESVPLERWMLQWQDLVALALIATPILFNWFRRAWPIGGLGGFPKLLFTDVALYGFLVCRGLQSCALVTSGETAPGSSVHRFYVQSHGSRPGAIVGYSYIPRWRDLGIGLREWLFFAPFGIGLGLALHFIHFFSRVPSPAVAAGAWLVTFFLVAVPEELFFRGLLLNLLIPRLGRRGALLTSAILFGLSHFNKGARFNWRYVLLASIAGIFYGRAWLDRRRIFSSAITHTAVDVTWSLWFR